MATAKKMTRVSVANATALRKKTATAARNFHDGAWELAELLYQVLVLRTLDTKSKSLVALWMYWGYESFDDYCFRELGLEPEQVNVSIVVYRRFSQVKGWKRADITGISIQRLYEIADVITTKDVQHWLKQARSTPAVELRENVKLRSVGVVRNTSRFTVVGALATMVQIRHAFARAMNKCRTTDRSSVLLTVLQFFINNA